MTDSPAPTSESHGSSYYKSSPKRLLLIAVIMVGFALLTWGPALFARGGNGVLATSHNFTLIFIPVWLTLTISTVVISMWFTKRLMEAEKSRDSEPMGQAPVAHSSN